MKKIYNAPEIYVLSISTKDVITVSVDEEGRMQSYSFKGFLGDGAGWMS